MLIGQRMRQFMGDNRLVLILVELAGLAEQAFEKARLLLAASFGSSIRCIVLVLGS